MFKNQRLQNMDRQELQDMLNSLSETELSKLGDLVKRASNKPRNRRRGSGKRKTKKKTGEAAVTKKSDPIDNLNLNLEEQKELDIASQFDQELGLDKPKTDGIMSKGPTFTKMSIKCMECQKTFEVAPALIPPERDRFRCNTCACRGRGQ